MANRGSSLSPSEGLAWAERYIKDRWGDTVSIDQKLKPLLKFGRNENVGTSGATNMTLPTGVSSETYVFTNAINTISSSNAANTQSVVIEGHTISGNVLTFVTQTATLNGQNKVTLTTPLARATRIYNNTVTNGNNLAGQVYVYQDTTISAGVPVDGTKVHLMTRPARNQSEKASTSISGTDYWIITSYHAEVLEKSSAFADVELQVRNLPGVFRQQVDISAESGSLSQYFFDPPLVVRKNSDVRLQAIGSAANIDVSGGMQGYLAKVIG